MIKSDQGKEFVNSMVANVLQMAKVRHNMIVAHNHHANGLVERHNWTVRNTLMKLIEACKTKNYTDEWELLVPAVQFAMNVRIHPELLASPFVLMFGRSPFHYSDESNRKDLEASQQDMLHFWKTFHRDVPDAVLRVRQIKEARSKYRHKTKQYKVGDYVTVNVQRTSKSQPSYNGIYRIVGVTDGGDFIVQSGSTELQAPANFLKPVSKELAEKMAAHSAGNAQAVPADLDQGIMDELAHEMNEEGIDDQRDRSYADSVTSMSNDDSVVSDDQNSVNSEMVSRKKLVRKPKRNSTPKAKPKALSYKQIRQKVATEARKSTRTVKPRKIMDL